MAENPFTSLTPALRLHPSGLRTPSRSPPRSPTRSRSCSPDRSLSPYACASDPLLANLSPDSTLRALSATDAVRTNGKVAEDILSKAIAHASAAERALAVRAAVIGQKLRGWHTEVLSWKWPQKRDAGLGKGFISPGTQQGVRTGNGTVPLPNNQEKYLGCLPAAVVEQHEERIDEIKAGMEMLDVEELKEHVLNAHIPSRSRPSSSASTWSTNMNTLSYVQLSDFTAVITATILQALPVLSKLNILLNTWDVRLTVLHQITGLLDGLGSTKRDIDAALDRLKTGLLPDSDDPLFSKTSFNAARHKLENRILIVGGKMDRILDSLEGHDDALPDSWIDDMEAIEAGFATWAFESEKMGAENEFRRTIPPSPVAPPVDVEKSKEADHGASTKETIPRQIENDGECKESTFHAVEEPIADVDAKVHDASSTSPGAESGKIALVDRKEITPVPSDVEVPPPSSTKPISPTPEPKHDEQTSGCHDAHLQPQNDDVCPKSIPNRAPSDSDTSSPLPSTPTDSTVEEEEISTPSSTDSPSPAPNQQSSDCVPDSSAEMANGHNMEHESTPELPSASTQFRPGKAELSEEHSSYIDVSPKSPRVGFPPQPEASPNQSSPFNTTNQSTSSPATTADLSPRKLAKTRPEPLRLETTPSISIRRNSVASIGSIGSGYLSYGSNPEIQDAQIAESHGSPMVVESPGGFFKSGSKSPWFREGDVSLTRSKTKESDDRTTSTPRPTVQRTMSLPLERFMDDQPEEPPEMEEPFGLKSSPEIRRASSASIEVLPKTQLRSIIVSNRASMGPTNEQKPIPTLRRTVSSLAVSSLNRISNRAAGLNPRQSFRGPRISTSMESLPSTAEEPDPDPEPSIQVPEENEENTKAQTNPAPPIVPRRSSKRLSKLLNPATVVPTQKQRKIPAALQSPAFPRGTVGNSLASPSLNTPTRTPEDPLDEKINSILTTIPARIHLASTPDNSNNPPRARDHRYSTPPKRERLRSESPVPTRSNTPTPSLTLTPAFRRSRRSHAHHDDDSSVRLYHLHRGGKAAPVKLFVRSVGEDGERVMVRVGGGWADLGEYLREYAVHHGRRNVSDGKFEVRGIPDVNTSPNSQSKLAPVPTNGRSTPISRPGSAFDIRPPSSLAVRKTRRSMVATSELPSLTTANIEKATEGSGPLSFFSSTRRRLSVSSNNSVAVASAYGDCGPYASTPLGLAGPTPKSRQVSMTPESEAWVEDVIGRARRTSATLRPERSYGNLRRFRPAVLQDDAVRDRLEGSVGGSGGHRSVSDTHAAGMNKRVYLKGLERSRD
ncbi:hypothetical protein FQN53_002204 [Emmonsiellopsis sp. PD_33]|nr:hypothetical protein FQN53_002204 [Emmonsiellopsis sp. PD_33]